MSIQDSIVSDGRLALCERGSSLEALYALMFGIRCFELSLLELFTKGRLSGTTHTCLGQEATAVGLVSCLDRDKDSLLSNHRCHGHFLAYEGDLKRLYLEIMGKPGGICAGRGGSQHLHWRNFYSNGIQGGLMPIAVGLAKAEKLRQTGGIVTIFIGDGTFGEGSVYEALKLMALWQLPVLIVVENNGCAQSTPTALQLSGSLAGRFRAFDIPVEELSTTDVRHVVKAASPLIDQVRQDQRPHALIIQAPRLGPHSKGDDHRGQEEMEAVRAKDPIELIRRALPAHIRQQIEERVRVIIDAACRQAEQEEAYGSSSLA